jgi:hypothetical protein
VPPLPKGIQLTKLEVQFSDKWNNSKRLQEANLPPPPLGHGIYSYLTIKDLVDDLNAYSLAEKGGVGYVKGIIRGGKKAEHLTMTSDLLFFDIDYKKVGEKNAKRNENLWLKNKGRRQMVKDFIQGYSVVIADSNSGTGMFGCINVVGLNEIKYHSTGDNPHKRIGESVYRWLENKVRDEFGIELKFDDSQAGIVSKRYGAIQTLPVELNHHPISFTFQRIVEEIKIPELERPVYEVINGPGRGSAIEKFNNLNSIESLLPAAGFEHVGGDRWRYQGSTSSQSGSAKNNVFFVHSQGFDKDHRYRFRTQNNPTGLIAALRPHHLYMVAHNIDNYSDLMKRLKKQGFSNDKINPSDHYAAVRLASTDQEIAKVCYPIQNQPYRIRKEFFNQAPIPEALKSIYKFYLNLKDYKIRYDEKIEIDERVSEKMGEILDIADREGKLFFNAATGSGKTTACMVDILKLRPNSSIILEVPLLSIGEQSKATYPDITLIQGSDLTSQDWAGVKNAQLVVATQNHAEPILGNFSNRFDYIIIDEFHSLFLGLSYKEPVIEKFMIALDKYLKRYPETKVIGMSGTPIGVFKKVDYYMLNVHKDEAPINVLQRHDGRSFQKIVRQDYTERPEDHMKVIYRGLVSQDELHDLKEWFIKKCGLDESEIVVFHSKEKASDSFSYLKTHHMIRPEVKVVLSSPVIDEGVNILNEDFDRVVYVDPTVNPRPETLRQFFSRLRSPKSECKFIHYQKQRKELFYQPYESCFDTIVKEVSDAIKGSVNDHLSSQRSLLSYRDNIREDGNVFTLKIAAQDSNEEFSSYSNEEFNDSLRENHNIEVEIDHDYEPLQGMKIDKKMSSAQKREILTDIIKNHFEEAILFLIQTTRINSPENQTLHRAKCFIDDINGVYIEEEVAEKTQIVQGDFIKIIGCLLVFKKLFKDPVSLLWREDGQLDSMSSLKSMSLVYRNLKPYLKPESELEEQQGKKLGALIRKINSIRTPLTMEIVFVEWRKAGLRYLIQNSQNKKALQVLISACSDLVWDSKRSSFVPKDTNLSLVKRYMKGHFKPFVKEKKMGDSRHTLTQIKLDL